MGTESGSKGGINFGDNTNVGGDVFTGDKNITTTYNSNKSENEFSQETLLELLKELKNYVKQLPLDEDERDIATGQISGAIVEAKQTNIENVSAKKDKIGEYLKETKTILDRANDVGEIGVKAFPIVKKIATLIGIAIL